MILLRHAWLTAIRCDIYTCSGGKIKRSIAMRKILMMILLAVGSLVISFVLFLVNMIFMASTPLFISIILIVFASIAVGYGTAGFYKKIHTKYGINGILFWTVAYAPQFFAGAGVLLWAYYKVANGHIFIGPQGLLYFYAAPISGMAYGIFGAIFTHVESKKLKGV